MTQSSNNNKRNQIRPTQVILKMRLYGWEQTNTSKLAIEQAILIIGFASNLFFRFTMRLEMYGHIFWVLCFLFVQDFMQPSLCTFRVCKYQKILVRVQSKHNVKSISLYVLVTNCIQIRLFSTVITTITLRCLNLQKT